MKVGTNTTQALPSSLPAQACNLLPGKLDSFYVFPESLVDIVHACALSYLSM